MGHGRVPFPLDYFLAMFPQEQLTRTSTLTSIQIEVDQQHPTTPGEILTFTGVLILATRFEFGSPAELWSTTLKTLHVLAAAFGSSTGIPRRPRDSIWSHVTFSSPAAAQGLAPAASSVRLRWDAVQGFVDNINTHRTAHVTHGPYLRMSPCRAGMGWVDTGSWWVYRLTYPVTGSRRTAEKSKMRPMAEAVPCSDCDS